MEKKKLNTILIIIGSVLLVVGVVCLTFGIIRTSKPVKIAEFEVSGSTENPSYFDVPPVQGGEEIVGEKEKESEATVEPGVSENDGDVETGVQDNNDGKAIEMNNQDGNLPYVEHQLICLADSKEQAEEVAAACNGRLVEYGYGVATIEIDITVKEFFDNGVYVPKKGQPEVSPNYIQQLD